MIIVEGPDGSGKTSLIGKMTEAFGLPVMPKAVNSQGEEETDLCRWVEQSMVRGWQPVIYDRHALVSEPIYGSRKGELRGDFKDRSWLELQYIALREVNPVIIVCLPSFEAVVKNVRADETNSAFFGLDPNDRHLEPVRRKVAPIYWAYHCLVANNLNFVHYDYEKHPLGSVMNYVQLTVEDHDEYGSSTQ